MQNYIKFSNILLFLVCISLIFTSYQGFAKALQKPVVIRKKIVPQHDVRATALQRTAPKSKSQIQLLKPKSEISIIPEKKEENGFEGEEIMLAAAGSSGSTKQAYDPASKIDPFEPLFQEKVNSLKPEITPIIDHQGQKGPLESIDTSQLKLTGIIYAAGRNVALVQEASGKGHVIKKGTYIGTNGGKVIEIVNKKVIIGEKWKDTNGNIYTQTSELKLLNKSRT
jgi:type IV pilus assembly protein PilP